MKTIYLLSLVVMVTADLYETPNDKFDYENVTTEQLTKYLNCMLDREPCTEPMAISQRKDGPEAIRTECKKCSKDLKRSFRIFLYRVRDELPEGWEEYKKKYDPDGVHMDPLLRELAKH